MSLLLYPISNRFSIAHSFQVSTSLFSPLSTLLSILFILALLVMLFLLAKKHPLISFSILFFFLNHLTESTILPLEIVFEHRNYIPSMFFFLPWAIGLCRLLDIYSSNRRMAQVFTTFTVIVLVALGHATYLRNFIWKSDWTLWADAAQKAPDQYRVHHNLGVFYRERGYWKEAMHEFQGALVCKEFHVKGETLPTHFQLARLFEDLGDYEKARFHYENVLRINPAYPQALGNLASIYDREGQRALADEYLLRAMKADPSNRHINFNMGLYWLRKRNPQEALGCFSRAKEEEDLKQPSLRYLGIALKQMERLGKASIYLRESVTLNSEDVTARLHLLEIFVRSGDKSKARVEATEVIAAISRDKRLLQQTIKLYSHMEASTELAPAASVVVPFLLQVCNSESEKLEGIRADLKKILQNKPNIR
jgi:Tfp pilus assembly protein PilF